MLLCRLEEMGLETGLNSKEVLITLLASTHFSRVAYRVPHVLREV